MKQVSDLDLRYKLSNNNKKRPHCQLRLFSANLTCKYLCRTSSMAGGIAMLEVHVRMSLQEGYHMREEDVFPVMHSVEIACNDNKLSPMML